LVLLRTYRLLPLARLDGRTDTSDSWDDCEADACFCAFVFCLDDRTDTSDSSGGDSSIAGSDSWDDWEADAFFAFLFDFVLDFGVDFVAGVVLVDAILAFFSFSAFFVAAFILAILFRSSFSRCSSSATFL
jgi:hypothetical protein